MFPSKSCPPMPTFWAAASEVLSAREFLLHSAGSLVGGIVVYMLMAGGMARAFPRKVDRSVFALNFTSDFSLGLCSLLFFSPVLSAFSVAHEKYCIMKTYNAIDDVQDGFGGWAWLAVSIPVYLLMFDAVFYVLHALVLHVEPFYSFSHSLHHAFKPPVAWSGIAIDPFESINSGLAPYLVPLFILPFHLPTVYAINIVLVGWAAWLHSSGPTPLHWALQSPLLHNAHHASGIRNGNYAPIFTHLDRLFGTLRDSKLPPWMVEEAAAAAAVAARSAKSKAM